MAKNPQAVAKKWQQNLSSAGESIKAGIEAVTQSPMEKAAERPEAYLQGVQRSVADGRWQEGLRKVSLADWKKAMIQKGMQRIGSGAIAAEGKMAAFLTKFLPHVEAGQRQLESMPRGDLATNIQRAIFMMNHNAQFRNN